MSKAGANEARWRGGVGVSAVNHIREQKGRFITAKTRFGFIIHQQEEAWPN